MGENIAVVAENDLIRCREKGLIGQLRPVIIDGHAETHIGKDRHQCLPYMAAAEDIDAACAHQRLRIAQRFSLAQNGTGGKKLRLRICLILVQDTEFLHYAAHDLQIQPTVGVGLQGNAHFIERRQLCRRQKLVVDRYVAAADHANGGHLLRREAKGPDVGLACFQNLKCLFGSDQLNRAAADSPAGAAVRKNRHTGSRTPRRRAGAGQNGAKYNFFSLFQGGDDTIRQIQHNNAPYSFIILQ